jgi:hypothetical protein
MTNEAMSPRLADDALARADFSSFYSRRRQAVAPPYRDTEFLYPNDAPWPEQSFDYPYGQAPTVSNIPSDERQDWAQNVGKYYRDNALGSLKNVSPFGQQSAEFARDNFARNGIRGYGELDDASFLGLICEGLYSKYLGRLDAREETLFGVRNDDPDWEYLKSDQSCMAVVTEPWPGEYVAPGIAVVRRRRGSTGDARFEYELVGIALARPVDGRYEFTPDLVFDARTHADTAAWWLAKYFVLQGAIHRINLVDHIKVHFPGDAINAVTKSVLPRWHLLQMLLLPHFRLQLPVNDAVLEGDRSIINRDTWYPWSPVTARGEEIRRLIPLAWAGSDFYWDEPNTSYPRFVFSTDPGSVANPWATDGARIETFVGLQASRYAAFLEDYHAPVLDFTRRIVDLLPDPASTAAQDDLQWLEIQRWAYEISRLVPGFPDQSAIRSKDVLARVCATVIWNAAIVHSADHSCLHMMIDRYPVPFILRVKPPASRSTEVRETIGDALGPTGTKYLAGAIHGLEGLLQKPLEDLLPKLRDDLVRDLREKHPLLGSLVQKLEEYLHADSWQLPAGFIDGLVDRLVTTLEQHELRPGGLPLCWPTDLVYCKMADLLFYRPHNTSLLWDCDYPFLQPPDAALEQQWRQEGLARPLLDAAARTRLAAVVDEFRTALDQVHLRWYDASGKPRAGEPVAARDIPCVLNQYGFPKLRPGSDDQDVQGTRMQACFGAGIQY